MFGDTEVTKTEFYENKGRIKLKDIILDKIIVSEKVKGSNDISKYYVGYIVDDNVIPLNLLLPIMSEWIKYFENGGKNMSFKMEDDEVYCKYDEIWNKIKNLLGGIKLSSVIIYDDQYIETKGKTFKMVKTLFDNDKIPQEKIEYECNPCISIDSVLKREKKYYPQVYLEQCKYRAKERKTKNLIDYDLNSDYESD